MSHTELLTFGQAAACLGIDVNTVRRWARSEHCPVIRDGRRRLIPAEWVEGIVAAPHRVGETLRIDGNELDTWSAG